MRATAALQDLDFEVVLEDGVPVEKTVHLLAMMLFRHVAQNRLRELGPDFWVGANQFVYYAVEQARAVAEEERQLALFHQGLLPDKPKKVAFRGPDAFVVKGVASRYRDAWMAWEENGRLPDLILELLSPSTAEADYGEKKRLYQTVFKAADYFLYEPRAETVDGFRLLDHVYQRIPRSAKGRLWSSVLQVEVGVWHGVYEDTEGPWLRLFYPDGRLVLTAEEKERQEKETAELRTEQERQAKEAAEQRAERERQAKEAALERATAVEIENARLLARLAQLEGRDRGQS
jgi:Uma2 family endonuclease